MRICHVASHEGAYRGGAVQLMRIAEEQRNAGHDVFVIAYERRRDNPTKKNANRETWRPLCDLGVRVDFLDYFRLADVFRMRIYFRRWKIDIVHAHRNEALLACARALLGTSRPSLIAQRGTTSKPPWNVGLVFRSAKVRAIVAVAKAVKSALVQKSNVRSEKIHVVYGSVGLEKFAPREKCKEHLATLGIPTGAPVIGCIAGYRKAKGLERLAKAISSVMNTHPNLHAIFIGTKVPKKLTPLIETFGNASRFRCLDHQGDVIPWFSIMDLTVMAATDREGLSGVLRESLAMNIPVIATDCPGNTEIVQDHVTGLIVPVRNRPALVDAIRWSLDHPDEIKRMAGEGRKWVVENCAPEIQIAAILKVYESALTPPRR